MGGVWSALEFALGLRSPPAVAAPMPNIKEKSQHQLRKEARAQLGIDTVSSYNFIFAGNSGTGKSSLINALMQVEDNSPGAAPVKDVGECTKEIKKYVHPLYDHIALWDAPGGGTPHHSTGTYFMDKKLYAFDAIIITGDSRLSELDVAIGGSAIKNDVPVAFVRTKSDEGIDRWSSRVKIPKRLAKYHLQREIVEAVRTTLPANLRDREIFVLSSHVLHCHDEFPTKDYLLDEEKFISYIQQVAYNRRNSGKEDVWSLLGGPGFDFGSKHPSGPINPSDLARCSSRGLSRDPLGPASHGHGGPARTTSWLISTPAMPVQLRREAQTQLGIDTRSYNFIFTGNSGSGKSSLINSLLGVEHNSPRAAKVGYGIECTKNITKYIHPRYDNIVLWEVPGGVPACSAATYFKNQKLYAFDAIIITSAFRFSEMDVAIAHCAKEYNIPAIFVRTKSDDDITGRSRRQREIAKSSLKYDLRREIVDGVRKKLPEDLRDGKIFILSSHVMKYPDEFPTKDYLLDEENFIRYALEVVSKRKKDGKGEMMSYRVLEKF